MYRQRDAALEVLLVHPGGPFWSRKDLGAWSIPKGEIDDGEEALSAARREFFEETGREVTSDAFEPLASVRLRSGKVIEAWAFEGDWDTNTLRSTTFSLEWPPRSGHHREFPEVDRASWFPMDEARQRIHPGQLPFLDRLQRARST